MEFEQWAEDKGLDLAEQSDAALGIFRAQWRSEQNPVKDPITKPRDDTPPDDLDAIVTRQRAETARQRSITALIGEAVDEHPGRLDELEQIGRSAIKGKWSEKDTELAVLRACRASAPAPLRQNGAGVVAASEKVIEAAMAKAAGLRSVEDEYEERTLEAAHKAFKGGMSIHKLLEIAAVQNGYRGSAPVKTNLSEVMRYAFTPRASGVSTIAVPGILSNIQNKFLRDYFMGVEQEWSKIAARRQFNDFKLVSTYSMTGDATFEEIPPGGHIPHGTLGETTYTNQAKSYGKMYGFDRRDIINDDLGAFSRIGQKLGRGGALKLNKVFWGLFLNNASFFSAGNLNVTTGAGSLISGTTGISALDAALGVFKALKDPDGNIMGTMPKILLVPPALWASARDLMDSVKKVMTTTANQAAPDGNPFAGMFQVVSSAYMQDTTLTGNSATASYLLADPNDVPVIEVGFLNGQEIPIVESAEADFHQLGIQYRGIYDFGVGLQEFRGGVRLAGA